MAGKWLGITLGDPTGVGPEVTFKALAALRGRADHRFLLIGDDGCVQRLNRELGARIEIVPWKGVSTEGSVALLQSSDALPIELPKGDPRAARAAMESLARAAQLCLSGDLAGVITAPVNKEAIIRAGFSSFIGQTEFLSGLAGARRTAMMLLGEDDRGRWLRVALVTTHLAISRVAEAITAEKVELAIELAAEACGKLKLSRARVGVCGLNPHAGEGGNMGTEEITTIGPAVERCRARGLDAHGPVAADTLFYHAYRGEYDAVVAMYHDQGLAPLKMIGFEKGINWTLGLPFVRTSPDHGTAYDIAGKGVANPSSMLSAIALAEKLTTGSARD